jgi:hypothetical protein
MLQQMHGMITQAMQTLSVYAMQGFSNHFNLGALMEKVSHLT